MWDIYLTSCCKTIFFPIDRLWNRQFLNRRHLDRFDYDLKLKLPYRFRQKFDVSYFELIGQKLTLRIRLFFWCGLNGVVRANFRERSEKSEFLGNCVSWWNIKVWSHLTTAKEVWRFPWEIGISLHLPNPWRSAARRSAAQREAATSR